MRIVGLTGSIGMGKTTTADMFRAAGVAVYDADAAVHRLYAGPAVGPVTAVFPGVAPDGKIERTLLRERVLGNPAKLAELEAIVHPLVQAQEQAFVSRSREEGRRLVILDIPLLLESGGSTRVDLILVVSAAAAAQRQRVLARPGMSETGLAEILARQMPDAEKRRRAHFVIWTDRGRAAAGRCVDAFLRALSCGPKGPVSLEPGRPNWQE